MCGLVARNVRPIAHLPVCTQTSVAPERPPRSTPGCLTPLRETSRPGKKRSCVAG
jgi:hypothetical protein